MHRRVSTLLAASLFVLGCSDGAQEGAGSAGDAGYYYAPPRDGSASPVDAGDAADAGGDASRERMQPHERVVLAAPRLLAIYVGDEGDGGAPSSDDMMTWLVASQYWTAMEQYGVGPGAMLPSVRVPASVFLPPGTVTDGLVDPSALATRVVALLHPKQTAASAPSLLAPAEDAGGDGGRSDAGPGLDAGDTPAIPQADAYVFFLPDKVNVRIPQGSGPVLQTCVEVGGYHTHDGYEPYAVIPPCKMGRSAQTISHELAEMATDPVTGVFGGSGWYSDAEVQNAGGEIGDLCNSAVSVEGWAVTRLWSNQDGACIPVKSY
jgi:hypothetical protein